MQSDSRFIQFSVNDLLRQVLSLIKAYIIGHRMHQDRHNPAIGGFRPYTTQHHFLMISSIGPLFIHFLHRLEKIMEIMK